MWSWCCRKASFLPLSLLCASLSHKLAFAHPYSRAVQKLKVNRVTNLHDNNGWLHFRHGSKLPGQPAWRKKRKWCTAHPSHVVHCLRCSATPEERAMLLRHPSCSDVWRCLCVNWFVSNKPISNYFLCRAIQRSRWKILWKYREVHR